MSVILLSCVMSSSLAFVSSCLTRSLDIPSFVPISASVCSLHILAISIFFSLGCIAFSASFSCCSCSLLIMIFSDVFRL